MKTKKIILLIITLALVCVAGFSGLVGAFAEELQRLQDLPFYASDDSQKDSYGFVINCQLATFVKTSDVSSSFYIKPIVTYFDPSTLDILGGSPSLGFGGVPVGLQIGEYYSQNILIQRTSSYQYVCVFFAIPSIYINTFSDLPFITGFTLTNNDGTTHNLANSSIIPQLGINGLFCVIPPAGSTSTINVNVELGYRSYTDAQYQQTYDNWTDAEYRESLLEAENLDYQYQISDLNETIDNLNEDYDNLYNDWEEERDSKEHFQGLLREANNKIDNLENQIQQLELIVEEQPVASGFGWIAYAFEKVGEILEIELLPGISIGLLCLIPLVLGVVFFVLRLIRGE